MIKQEEIAKKAGVSRRTVATVLKGKKSLSKRKVLHAYLELLKEKLQEVEKSLAK